MVVEAFPTTAAPELPALSPPSLPSQPLPELTLAAIALEFSLAATAEALAKRSPPHPVDRHHHHCQKAVKECLPGLLPHDKSSHGISTIPDRDLHIPSLAVEILPSKNAHPYKYAGENVDLQGLNIFKGRVSVVDIIGFTSNSEMVSSKPEGKC